MEIIGLIAEYNPFHNGHKYQINKIKEMFPDSLLIVNLSGNFTQRGEPSLIEKFTKSKIAILEGIDIVIELPYPFATGSADFFAKGAISLLNAIKVDYLIFGSESNDLSSLKKLVSVQLNNDQYNLLCKVYLQSGYNYPTALSLALKDLTNISVTLPNDILALSYLKALINQNTTITPLSIKRTNDYHSLKLKKIMSATAIREALKENKDISLGVPYNTINNLNDLHFSEDYFPFLRYKILVEKDLNVYFGIDEGISPRIKKAFLTSHTIKEALNKINTKRYTTPRINRMLCNILVGYTKEEALNMKEITYIRVLDYSMKGQEYLHHIKTYLTLPLITTYSRLKDDMLKLELRTTSIYAMSLDFLKQDKLIKEEYQHFPQSFKNK
ncbi:MAG: nucleotidyltransferase [Bacilli bacterium]